jgi:predicted nicotinamide N-methyase
MAAQHRCRSAYDAAVKAKINPTLSALLPPTLAGARIEATDLPAVPALALYLLNADYPQQRLGDDAVRALMEDPLYWVFCWASGQVLAAAILANPEWVRGRRVLDFGAGSGVVAVAAARAGAAEVVACDRDPRALVACRENAALNGVALALAEDFELVQGRIDLITAADVLYDRANLPWLDRFVDRAGAVLVGDSRLRDVDRPRYRVLLRQSACTWPDLDESAEFRRVTVYAAGAPGEAP